MKIFAIRESNNRERNIGFLFYYERVKQFYIELLDNLEEWDIPLLLSSLYKKGLKTITSYWSKIWVEQRIVPSDRQNIGQILKDNKLKTYDEFELLMLANGRCEQDNFYLTRITEKDLPKGILDRFETRVDDIMLLKDENLLVFFRNGEVKIFDLKSYFNNNKQFGIINNSNYLEYVKILVGGYGVYWDNNLEIMDYTLYALGEKGSLTLDIITEYVKNNILTTAEVMSELNCSRQYVNELVKNKRLHPIKSSEKNTLYLKSEVVKINWY